jgi:hypothetical protein
MGSTPEELYKEREEVMEGIITIQTKIKEVFNVYFLNT